MKENEATASAGDGVRIFTGKLHRTQRGHGKAFLEGPPTPPRGPVRRPARVAIMLALAHKIQAAIDRGAVRDSADVATRLGLSRARISQLLDLTLLAPQIQERILFAESVDGLEPLSERALRAAVRVEDTTSPSCCSPSSCHPDATKPSGACALDSDAVHTERCVLQPPGLLTFRAR